MQDTKIVFREYEFVSITENVYHPTFKNGKWYLVGQLARPFNNVAYLCDIPDDEAVILKLKYGA